MMQPHSAPSEASSYDAALRERFGLSGFRPWQREAIDALLEGQRRVLVVAPTGGGKSLTYQFPATLLAGTTLVISPLVALMEDQVRSLDGRGIAATYLASTLDSSARRQRESDMMNGRYKLVYCAPERLASEAFVSMLTQCNIDLVAIDEAHCISQWGHDFRPDYLRIGALLDRLRPPRILACTATATPLVRSEIRQQLGWKDGECHEVLRGFARPNLHLAARSVEGPKQARAALFEAIEAAIGEPRHAAKGGVIVYTATRKAAEEAAKLMASKGYRTGHYHAGMEAASRSRVAHAFATRKIDIVAATNAFGMGIDRSDIRAVVHLQPPASIEAYYQEVGRAGRDGEDAHGLLLCSGVDIALRRRLSQSSMDGAAVDPELAARAWGLFRELLRYLDARSCRHDFVLRYFGDEREVLGGCGHCDICETLDGANAETEAASEETSLIVRKALSGIARARQRAGLQAIAEMLHGVDGEKTRRFGFTTLSTFGLLRDHSHEWIVSLLRAFLAAGWMDLTPTEHPVPFLTKAGGEVMRGEGPVRIVLPTAPRARTRAPRREATEAPNVDLDADGRAIFERLRIARAALAKERGVPAYVIAQDRTLVALAAQRPCSMEQLHGIHGFGPHRIEHYGETFLRVLAQEGS